MRKTRSSAIVLVRRRRLLSGGRSGGGREEALRCLVWDCLLPENIIVLMGNNGVPLSLMSLK